MKPQFRKVYGYRAPNGVREVPENHYTLCNIRPLDLRDFNAELLEFDLLVEIATIHSVLFGYEETEQMINRPHRTIDELRTAVRYMEHRINGVLTLHDKKQPMQDRIDCAFKVSEHDDQQQLQNILDKVKRHL